MPDWATGVSSGLSLWSANEASESADEARSLEEAALQLEIDRDRFNKDQVEQTNKFAVEDRDDIIARRQREREMLDPVQEGIVERAMEGPDYEGAAARSDADVTQSYGLERGKMRREQQRYGVNPASGRSVVEGRKFANQEALAKVQGRNRSRLQEDDRDWARKMAALGTGNMRNATPTTNLQQLGISGAAGAYNSMAASSAANATGAYQFAGSMFADAMKYGTDAKPSSSGGSGVDYDFYGSNDFEDEVY